VPHGADSMLRPVAPVATHEETGPSAGD
jgi:hypothetical protein